METDKVNNEGGGWGRIWVRQESLGEGDALRHRAETWPRSSGSILRCDAAGTSGCAAGRNALG